MAGKIMIVTGGGRRNGNTATIANWVAEGAREAGTGVEIVDAAGLGHEAHGCAGCMGCQNSKEYRCVVRDEVSETLARVPECSALVLASPVYFMGFSAQLKLFIDRMRSLIKIDYDTHKVGHALKDTEIALLATCGGDEASGLELIKSNIVGIAGFLGKKARKFVVPFAPFHTGSLADNLELRGKARAFGAELAGARPPIA